MTPDQLAYVERLRDWLKQSGGDADAIAALLREREALRAALAKLWREVVASGNGEADNDGWPEARRLTLALLTGTTARTEGK